MGFRVIEARTRETLPGLPTPRLIEMAGTNDAFERDGIWFLREDGTMHVSPDGTYTKVQVRHTDEWTANLKITVIDGNETYDESDLYVVDACDRNDAETHALESARIDIERRFGDVATDIRIISVKEGNGIFG